jgi:hypothetical protein
MSSEKRFRPKIIRDNEVDMIRKIALWGLACLIGWGASALHAQDASLSSTIAVWSQADGSSREIFFSRQVDGVWSAPVVLSRDTAQNVTPSVARSSDGRIWVVWTTLLAGEAKLVLCHSQGDGWSSPSIIDTGMRSNTAPGILFDTEGILWLVWSGNNGGNDDIFVMRWDGKSWSGVERVHPANDVPDVLPSIETGVDGMPLVKWSRFSDGQYRIFCANWQGKQWSTPVEVGANVSSQAVKSNSADLPSEVQEPDKASVLESGRMEGTSIRDRFENFRKRTDRLNGK